MNKLNTRQKVMMFAALTLLIALIACAIILPLVIKDSNAEAEENDLPIIEITTQNKQLPTNKVDYINSSFKLSGTVDDETYSIDVTMKESTAESDSVGIRLRGNSTMGYDKKPYRIKFDKKQSVFGSAKNKNWVLLADFLDPSLIKNYSALRLAQILDNMPWNPVGTHVNLYLNGDYKGVYLLCDQIDEKEGRLDIESDNAYESGQTEYPFLVEISEDHERDASVDKNDLFNVQSFVTAAYQPNGSPAEIKYPEYGDGRPDDATQYISSYVNQVFDSLWAGDISIFESLVDVDSFVDYVLLNEICSNSDAVWKSIYISKKNGEKMKFGPVWDFDGAFGIWTGNPDDTNQNYALAFSTVYSSGCLFVQKYFLAAGADGLNRFAARLAGVSGKIDAFYLDLVEYKDTLKKDGTINQELWYIGGDFFEKNYDANLLFFINHITYLRNLFLNNYSDFLSIVYG